MGISKETKKNLKKAVKQKNKRRRGSWLFICHGDGIGEIFSKLFTQFAVLVLIACGVVLANEVRLSLSAKQLNSGLREIFESYKNESGSGIISSILGGEPEMTAAAKKLCDMNPDTIGYLNINGTDISMPVVQRRTSDGNTYYLKTAFDGSPNKAGTLFLDYRARLEAKKRSDVLTVYGHNQRDLTMFGELKFYKHDLDYYKAHPTVEFSSNYETSVYKIFAYFVTETLPEQTSDGVVFDYHNYIDLDRDSYEEFVGNIMERTQILTSVDVEYGDEFLVLSTCSSEFEDSRFVVFARKTRDGEDTAVDTSAAVLNENAKEPDWNFIY